MFRWTEAAQPRQFEQFTPGSWSAANRHKPCPICGKPDWCTASDDGQMVYCMRVPDGSISSKDLGHGTGYLHRICTAEPMPRIIPVRYSEPTHPKNDSWLCYGDLVAGWSQNTTEGQIAALSESLAVSVASLNRMEVAWCADRNCWAFPMHDSRRQIIGVRFRTDDGRKFALTGSHAGAFIPSGLDSKEPTLLICEGPTDTAAALTIGFEAIGRPSCSGASEIIADMLQDCRRKDVVIVADNDGPGRAGAHRLADRLLGVTRSLKVIDSRPHKDIRAWLQAGATMPLVQIRINQAYFWGSR